ncbi:hypothetical protein WJ02_06015 [Burkholderia vietnamiensis]|nr:hypothetical protein WJ02_06015 [Burkholderia vietnamiensis]
MHLPLFVTHHDDTVFAKRGQCLGYSITIAFEVRNDDLRNFCGHVSQHAIERFQFGHCVHAGPIGCIECLTKLRYGFLRPRIVAFAVVWRQRFCLFPGTSSFRPLPGLPDLIRFVRLFEHFAQTRAGVELRVEDRSNAAMIAPQVLHQHSIDQTSQLVTRNVSPLRIGCVPAQPLVCVPQLAAQFGDGFEGIRVRDKHASNFVVHIVVLI